MISKLQSLVCGLSRTDIAFLFILLLAALLRLYRLPLMANYDFDQEYVTEFVLQVVREYPVRYVGQGMSIQGLFMGPWYFYFLVPFYLLTGLNPLGGYLGSIVIGLATVTAYYFLGKRMFGVQVGFWTAFWRAISFQAIEADWSMTPAFSSDLIVLATWYGLYQLWQGHRWWLVPLGLIFGLYTSFHPIQFPFYLVFLILWGVRRWRFTKWQLGLSGLAFGLPVAPLILFDYWRHGAMLKQIIGLAHASTNHSILLWLTKIWVLLRLGGQFMAELMQLPAAVITPLTLLLLLGVLGLTWYHYRQRSVNFNLLTLIVTVVVFLLFYLYFPGNVPEYYLGAIRALMFLYGGLGFVWILRQGKIGWVMAVTIVSLVTVRNLQALAHKWQYPLLTTLAEKQLVVQHLQKQSSGQPFRVNYLTKLGWDSGFRSLFAVSQYEPGETGPLYNIVVPADLLNAADLDFRAGNVGLLYPAD